MPTAGIPAPPAKADASPTMVFNEFTVGAPLRLVAYGDMRFTNPSVTSGTNPRVRKWLAEKIASEHPQAILMTGDMPYTGSDPADWKVFQDETSRWRAQHILQLPATGNHEIRGDRIKGINNYLANFPSIGKHRYYSALLGSVEVISLDCSMASTPTSPQSKWYADQLNHVPPQVEFLVILHHIPWMADRQSQIFVGLPTPQALALRNVLEDRLDKIHAKVIVFNGHIHNYERFERRGVEYVITGGGGAEPYPLLFRGHSDLYQDSGFPVYHYLTIDVSNHQFHALMWKVKNPDDPTLSVEQKDEFTIQALTSQSSPAGKTQR
ncbi:MAG TPA: metallophosphoesterase [Terracidiphilus sp.]